jgi:hypothetical protein
VSYLGDTALDKTPGGAIDIVKLWSAMKLQMQKSWGVYSNPDGSPIVMGGKVTSIMNYKDATTLLSFWSKYSSSVLDAMSKSKLNTSSIITASKRFQDKRIAWTTKALSFTTTVNGVEVQTPNTYLGKYMPLVLSREAIDLLDGFVISLSAARWAGYNIETEYQRMHWALDHTTGGSFLKPVLWGAAATSGIVKGLPGFLAVMGSGLGALASLWPVLKWGAVAGGGYYAWKKLKPKVTP